MPYHTVEDGEWIGSIAAKGGHKDWKTVWEHRRNQRLRQKRNPNLLAKGDRVYIPKVRRKRESGDSEARHRFVVQRAEDKLLLRFVEIDAYVQAFGPIHYRLKVGKHVKSGTLTQEDQTIEIPLNIAVDAGSLLLEGCEFKLDVGGLDPRSRLSGMQARLSNLGWDSGPIDNRPGPKTRRGTRDFQSHYGIKVDGEIGSETRRKAKEIYGC